MNTVYLTPPRILRREHETAHLLQVLADLNAELAGMPASKASTQWAADRMAEKTRLLRTLAKRGVTN